MKKLINKIAKDKLLHLIGGTYIFLLSNIFFEKWIAMFGSLVFMDGKFL